MKNQLSSYSMISMMTLALFSCEVKQDREPIASSAGAHEKNSIPLKQQLEDKCLKRQKEFLKWYLANYEKIHLAGNFVGLPKNTLKLLGADSLEASTTDYYQFKPRNMEVFLNGLKRTGYFSNYYIDNKRKDMLKRGKALDAVKQEDGPAEGFDFDEVFNTQEMYTIENIANLKPDSARVNTFIIPITDDFRWVLHTSNHNGTCVIDSITSE